MKLLLFLIIVGVLALGAAYFLGGVSGMDPAEQVAAFKASVKPGMTWEQVAAAAKPQQVVGLADRNGMIIRQAPQRFDPDLVKQTLANSGYPEGFLFIHRFTNRDVWAVHFTSNGKAEAVEKEITESDIIEGKLIYPQAE